MKKLIEDIDALLRIVFGDHVPPGVSDAVGVLLVLAFFVLLLYGVIIGFGKVAKTVREDIRPLFYDETQRRRASRRRQFADHVESEMRRIDMAEEWRDYKYAELEAEVEAEGRRRGFSLRRQPQGLRRERSLSVALRNSRERLVLLEGEPGSGKTVALHYLTSTLARDAMKSRNASTVIPLYINLKSIDRAAGRKVDAALIEAHVVRTLNRSPNRDIEEFLNDEFRQGMRDGTWLFLFDSFDEIPDILSVTSAESTIQDYGNAIADFLAGFNRCRGIVASRYFRGPGTLKWPRFRIMALSDRYRRNLIQRAQLAPSVERALIGEVELARPDLAAMSQNPMFLGLLCEYMRSGRPFPATAHTVFEDYVTTRLQRDRDKLRVRFVVEPEEVRQAAETAAFAMAATDGLGLNPARAALAAAMRANGFAGDAETMLDAMVYIKLARAEEQDRVSTFTFAHRRFQEYFATRVVLEQPDTVAPETLLTDARWRETAVVLLQTQENAAALIETAAGKLQEVLAEIQAAFAGAEIPLPENMADSKAAPALTVQFPWPPLALHLLALLQAGFRGRQESVPEAIRELAGRILLPVAWCGSLADRRWAIEVAGIAPQPLLMRLLRDAYTTGSGWLGEAAYRQAGMLRTIDEAIARPIRHALVKLFVDGRLGWQRHSTRAHLMRLPDPDAFASVLRLLLAVQPIDVAVHVVIAVVAISLKGRDAAPGLLVLAALLPFSYAIARVFAMKYPKSTLGIILYLRFLLVFSLFLSANLWPLVLAAGWAPMAVLAAVAGQFTHPGWWPMLPALPVLYMARNARRMLRENASFFASWSWEEARIGGAVILLFSTVGVLSIMFWIVGLAVVAAITIVFFVNVATALRRQVHDRLRLYRIRRDDSWSGAEIVDMLDQLQLESSRAKFIRSIRQRSVVAAHPANEEAVRDYAVQFESWLNQRVERDAINIVLLDELNMLAEQLRSPTVPIDRA